MTSASRMPVALGQRVRELREWSGLSISAVAAAIKCSSKYYREIEQGKVRATHALRVRLADCLDCDASELHLHAAWGDRPSECLMGCNHHGEMRPGGTPAAKRDECAYYVDCLKKLVAEHSNAKNGHCPGACSAFVEVPQYVRIARDGGQNGDTRYDDAEAPGDIALPPPKTRLPLTTRHSGTQTAQLCGCSQCESARNPTRRRKTA